MRHPPLASTEKRKKNSIHPSENYETKTFNLPSINSTSSDYKRKRTVHPFLEQTTETNLFVHKVCLLRILLQVKFERMPAAQAVVDSSRLSTTRIKLMISGPKLSSFVAASDKLRTAQRTANCVLSSTPSIKSPKTFNVPENRALMIKQQTKKRRYHANFDESNRGPVFIKS